MIAIVVPVLIPVLLIALVLRVAYWVSWRNAGHWRKYSVCSRRNCGGWTEFPYLDRVCSRCGRDLPTEQVTARVRGFLRFRIEVAR